MARQIVKSMPNLDLGCGMNKTVGSFGVDCHSLTGVDVVCDLTHLPYPFLSGSADHIYMSHVLEHMENPVEVLAEVWRISRRGGRVHIRVPHYTGPYAWKDPTHRRCFSSESFDYFGLNSYSYYSSARYGIESLRLKYFMVPPRRLLFRLWGVLVQFILDRHPTFAERFLAYLVGGIDEIQVTLTAIKTETEECSAQPDSSTPTHPTLPREGARKRTLC